MGKTRADRRRYSQVVVGIAALVLLVLGTCAAEAASFLNSCTTYCHGTPPRDGARKGNPHFGSQSSAFLGNHKNHLAASPTTNDCSICHAPVAATGFGHQNNVINMAVKLKGYSTSTGRAKYDKGVFINMTSIPNLTSATCSNVNCHFEKKTPVWGAAAYNPATDCGVCHGAPPAGTLGVPAGGTAGSHARHDVYYPGTSNCQKCHPGYATFTHATSAGRPLKVQGFLRTPLNTLESGGTYSGSGANYLPSKSASQVFGSCNTIYCHSSGQSATGTATGISYKAVNWGGAAPNCAGCHLDMATDATGTGNHKVHTLATGTNLDCVRCHLGYTKTTVTTTTHANGLIELGAAGFTYSQGSGATHPVANGFGTCSASACHGSGTVTWGATAAAPVNGFPFSAVQCAKCHSGNLATDVTAANPFYSTATPKVTVNTNAKVGAHTSHLTAPDGLATAFACTDCHGTVTLTAATHMNGTTNFTWSTLATKSGALVPAYTAATGTCANVYCHGASMPGGDTTGTNRAPTWISSTYLPATLTAAACATCHGFPPPTAAGHPAVTIPAGFPATATIGTTCSCHANINTAGNSYANIFVNKALHVNGTVEVSGGHAVPFYAHATPPFTSCTGCHNASAAGPYPAATAGTAPNCRGCHVTADPTVTATGCTSCHTVPPSGTAHPNILGSHTKHSTVACTTCHNGAGAGSGAAHGPGNKGTNLAVDNIVFTAAQAGASATWTAATKTCSTTYCHGDTLAGGGTAKSPVWGTTLTGCGTCHGDPPATSTHTGVTVTQCIGCHPHVNAAGTGFTDATKHMNGVIDASGGVSAGGTTCYTCHSSFQSAMDATGATRTATYHHVLGGALGNGDIAPNTGTYPTSTTDVYCTSCHTDHNYFNAAKAANLRSAITTASGAAPINTDFQSSGSFGICVSCHGTSLTRDTTNQKAGGVATTPVIAGATFAASMHNYTTMSSFGTQQFAANCVKCHSDEQAKDKQTSTNKFGPHFSASTSLLDDLGAGTNAQYREQYICFRCHSQATDTALGGTRKPANGKDWFGSNTMRASAEDTFKSFSSAGRSPRHKISAYSGLHKVNETRTDIAASKHVECADCHNPHAAKLGTHTVGSATLAGVLTGVSGVDVTTWGANWAGVATTAYNPSTTTAALITATTEWQVCFKCHSGANANAATWGGTGAAAFTDLALEFNPNNASGHPIVTGLNNYPNSPAPKALAAATMKAPWNVNLGTQVMTCSDCHATDSTASKGPHGSSVKWMLAGTNKAWPYTTTAGNGTSTGTLFRIATYNTGDGTANGLFCLNCHTIRPATGANSWHSNSNVTGGQHGGNAIMACASCHIRVPHGGKISRLLQTTNAPARYKSNGNGATSNFTQFGPTTGTVKGSAASSSTFNSSCGEHSGTGGEAW